MAVAVGCDLSLSLSVSLSPSLSDSLSVILSLSCCALKAQWILDFVLVHLACFPKRHQGWECGVRGLVASLAGPLARSWQPRQSFVSRVLLE